MMGQIIMAGARRTDYRSAYRGGQERRIGRNRASRRAPEWLVVALASELVVQQVGEQASGDKRASEQTALLVVAA